MVSFKMERSCEMRDSVTDVSFEDYDRGDDYDGNGDEG